MSDDENPRARHEPNRDLRDMMRGMLRANGIELDQPAARPRATVAKSPAPPVDREAIRAILIERGAPEKDLDWMASSCPGVEYARAYRPTIRAAEPEAEEVTDAG